MSEASEPSSLETATTEELVGELHKRADACFIMLLLPTKLVSENSSNLLFFGHGFPFLAQAFQSYVFGAQGEPDKDEDED